jgi:hypothetical protein
VIDTELDVLSAEDVRRDLPFPKEKGEMEHPMKSIWTSKFIFTLLSLASFDFHTS